MSTWTTNDGRVLLIAWMDSTHLVNSFNMLIRKTNLGRHQVEGVVHGKEFNAMRAEIKARGLFIWSGGADAQLVRPDFRETLPQMCLTRALLDSGVPWPGILDHHAALSCIRNQFESAFLSLSHCAHRGAGDVILAKYAEYRLAPPVQWR